MIFIAENSVNMTKRNSFKVYKNEERSCAYQANTNKKVFAIKQLTNE
jgi:hypothetical protein